MRLIDYLKDKVLYLILNAIILGIMFFLLILFKLPKVIIFSILFVLILKDLLIIAMDYYKRAKFYNEFAKSLSNLDQKYLISELLSIPNFIDGKLVVNYLEEINKSMHEHVNSYKYDMIEFKEYLELWCHEIKTPVATSNLIIDNNKNQITNSIQEEIKKIENYIEQIMFYSKSDNVKSDYIIGKTNLQEVVNSVVKRNKKDLISKKIKINIGALDVVRSDAKWLEFILNQIMSNSIKYSKDKNAFINIFSRKEKNTIYLLVEDNGIGIEKEDISKVFEKGFTGHNGRKLYNSTGIGLYLCKKLCNKLEHGIFIDSIINEKTIVTILFPENNMTSRLT